MCIDHEKCCHSYRILMKLEFFKETLKNTQISNFMKIRPVTAELFHADRRTESWTDGRRDVAKLIDAI